MMRRDDEPPRIKQIDKYLQSRRRKIGLLDDQVDRYLDYLLDQYREVVFLYNLLDSQEK